MLVLSTGFVVAPQAEAACSYNGYTNSNGTCSNSFVNTNSSYQYFNQSSYQNEDVALLLMIEQLQDMIRTLLGRMDNSNTSSSFNVTTYSATDVEDDEAVLRGRISLGREDEAEVYFEYGRTRGNLNKDTRTEDIDEDDNDFTFEKRITNLDDSTNYYFRAVAEDEDGDKDRGKILAFRTDGTQRSNNNDDEPDLDTQDAQDIEDNSAELNGKVDMNDFNNGEVFFVYGEDEDHVEDVEDDFEDYDDVDEDGDDLQKVEVDNDLDGNSSYNKDVSNLDEDTKIYYSICVGYEDEDDDDVIKCGDVESFETDDDGSSNSNDDEPELETDDAKDVEDNSAELHGSVDMNDFDNGKVFFAYGEDEDQVEDIKDDYDQYSDIDEDGDDLQRIVVGTGLDNRGTYWAQVGGLDSDTNMYYSICVEYEDEDGDDVISCGNTESFRTDD